MISLPGSRWPACRKSIGKCSHKFWVKIEAVFLVATQNWLWGSQVANGIKEDLKLTHFMALVAFPWKHEKSRSSLMFLGVIESTQQHEMGKRYFFISIVIYILILSFYMPTKFFMDEASVLKFNILKVSTDLYCWLMFYYLYNGRGYVIYELLQKLHRKLLHSPGVHENNSII